MTALNSIDDVNGETGRTVSRRTVMKGAAWAAPVLALSMAAPMAAASVNNSGISWTGTQTGLLSLNLLGGGLINSQALITVPTEFTITNGSGAISGVATATITVSRPAGINIPVGRARGFGVYSYNGTQTTSGQRSAAYQAAPVVGEYGFPSTTAVVTQAVTIPSNGTLSVPVVFGLAGTSTGVSISALASFGVTLELNFGGGVTRTATSTIIVPVGAGIL